MPDQLFQLSYSLSEIDNAVQQFWLQAQQYRIIAFSGQLGAGKTTFVHHLCDYLGVTDAVSSPTFALINEYHFSMSGKDTIIYHMDWYRLKNQQEAIDAGMEDCLLNKDVYCFIEWPEKAVDLLSTPYLWVEIVSLSENTRQMTVLVK
jgi:tRNA threonylcarbamoyladenosine biosynthesis protein TsaE